MTGLGRCLPVRLCTIGASGIRVMGGSRSGEQERGNLPKACVPLGHSGRIPGYDESSRLQVPAPVVDQENLAQSVHVH